MRIGLMFGDVIRSLFSKPVTQIYPFERLAAPDQLRGKLVWDPAKCVGCQLCVKDCPAGAIELFALDKPPKHFVLRYNIDRCVYCGQCVQNCRFKCLDMSSEMWELAAIQKQPFTVYFGSDEDIALFLGKTHLRDTSESGEG